MKTKTSKALVMIVILNLGLIMMHSCSSNNSTPLPTLTPMPILTSAIIQTSSPTLSAPTIVTTAPFDETSIRILQYENYYQSLPPGRYLTCFHSGDDFNSHRLDAIRVDNGERFQYLEGFIAGGSISPDGKRVAVYFEDLYIIDLETGEYDKYTVPNAESSLSWAPDGTQIAFDTDLEGFRILSLVDGTLTNIPVTDINIPTATEIGGFYGWSPDQNWFAFYRQYNRGPELIEGLYLFDTSCFDTPEICMPQARKIASPPLNGPIAWTPDNNLAVVDWSINNGETINIYSVPDGEVIRSYSIDSGLGPIEYFFWLSDDNWIVVNEERSPVPLLISVDGQISESINSCTGRSSYSFTVSTAAPNH